MDTTILNPKVSIKFKIKDQAIGGNNEEGGAQDLAVPETRKKVKEKKITVYSKTVTFQEIAADALLKQNKLIQNLKSKVIGKVSWTVVSEQLGSRSADDVRHFWNRKLLPILCPN